MKGASPQSREGEWSRVGKRVTRRRFLKETGLTLAATSAAPLISAPFVSRTLADTKTLTIVQWSHFVPAYDTWFDRFAKNWGEKE
jgi:multiple sugar transport system substrate-binding protein